MEPKALPLEPHPVPSGASDDAWLQRFQRGDAAVLAALYHEHFDTVARAVGGVLNGADRESVIHEVFYRLVASPAARASFQGGSLGAWLSVVARRQALDFSRARGRERAAVGAWAEASEADRAAQAPAAEVLERRLEARRRVEAFRRERLPAKWEAVFDAIFIRGLSQREAAAELGMSRTTLAYQELRLRHLLKQFFLSPEAP
ncbi:MAG TPA: RNA polymerase sigma factor [Aggregicoccus sp.]|nr:RNA polymerase sigma factor [Aggregicoccus sp.]